MIIIVLAVKKNSKANFSHKGLLIVYWQQTFNELWTAVYDKHRAMTRIVLLRTARENFLHEN